ncbi:hypothetical protein HK099_006977 [Clydaea vesicula]|uniref:Uncharacterized protein n=1 Tax=Clydaea vesicula TaxID=447962 RepID=A0AAD5XY13_9FUNG|nr:hypothetical protein HK099_006977 [Clydaea vesicula]
MILALWLGKTLLRPYIVKKFSTDVRFLAIDRAVKSEGLLGTLIGNFPGATLYSILGSLIGSLNEVDRFEMNVKLRYGLLLIGCTVLSVSVIYITMVARRALRLALLIPQDNEPAEAKDLPNSNSQHASNFLKGKQKKQKIRRRYQQSFSQVNSETNLLSNDNDSANFDYSSSSSSTDSYFEGYPNSNKNSSSSLKKYSPPSSLNSSSSKKLFKKANLKKKNSDSNIVLYNVEKTTLNGSIEHNSDLYEEEFNDYCKLEDTNDSIYNLNQIIITDSDINEYEDDTKCEGFNVEEKRILKRSLVILSVFFIFGVFLIVFLV